MIGRISFWVPGKPIGYSRSAAKRGVLPEANVVWRHAVQVCYREAIALTTFPSEGEHTGDVLVAVAFHGSKADIDNLVKELLDALNGIAYKDDRQVCQLEVARGTQAEPGAAVMLTFQGTNTLPVGRRGKKAVVA